MTLRSFRSTPASVRTCGLALLVALLSGCASFSADRGFGAVGQIAKDKLGKDVVFPTTQDERDAVDRRVSELLANPLTADAAVQVALLNNPGLQASFNELGISEAELVQSTRLPNPGFSIARLKRGDEVEIERSFGFNLANLLAMPLVKEVETRRFQQTQAQVALRVLTLAADTRKAYVNAVAAEEGERYTRQVQRAADASAELARRMGEAGNFNKLQQLREQSFYADATQSVARAQRLKVSSRERLTRLMGLWGERTSFTLPERLPDLPGAPTDRPDVERIALAQRMDVQAAKLATEQTARNLGLSRTTRFVNVLELGVVRNSSNEAPTQRGYEIGLELPLFDWGTARVARAEAVYMQSLYRASETAINARSEAREAYGAYRSAYDIARHHRDEIVPLRQRIAEENVLRYNGMLIGVFELLADARAQIASVNASIEALRDFWLAQADLDMALVGPPASRLPPPQARRPPKPAARPTEPRGATMSSRRNFLGGTAAVAAAAVSKVAMAALPEPVMQDKPDTMPPLVPSTGRPYNPVVTLNGWTLPWRMNAGVKEFHLVAEPVVREMSPGFKAHLWGYNGQSPGPTIEVVEGDRVRIFVTNKLPEHTSVHWHGQRLPNGMDGVTGLTQPGIQPGKTFVYEFVARRPGTFMYHPHADEMVQMAMGMMGFWITHPKQKKHPLIDEVDRDFVFLLNAYDIDPGAYTPKIMTMLDFNLWSWNSRVFPGIDTLNVRKNDRVRIRIGNLTMTNHPIHLHGHEFVVTGTDGGPTPKSTRWMEVTTDIAVGQMRQIEFLADEEGDWAFHCHKSHHTMNAMGHNVPTMIGVDHRDVVRKITGLIPDYMVMGERGMADMAEMQMPLPDNTAPMMSGDGPFGSVEMGGMFTTVKVRRDQRPGDYKDPGWFKHPAGTVAYEWTGALGEPVRPASEAQATGGAAMPTKNMPVTDIEVQVRKPGAKPGGHAGH